MEPSTHDELPAVLAMGMTVVTAVARRIQVADTVDKHAYILILTALGEVQYRPDLVGPLMDEATEAMPDMFEPGLLPEELEPRTAAVAAAGRQDIEQGESTLCSFAVQFLDYVTYE